MKILVKYWFFWLPTILAIVTMILAYSHYQMIDDVSEYRDSALIRYEFIFLFCALVSLFGVGLAFVIYLIKRNWVAVGFSILGVLLGCLSLSFALYLDSPTLIYMT